MKILVTGGAGFIGSNLIDRLLEKGYFVTCYDNFCNSYSIKKKIANIAQFNTNGNFQFVHGDIRDPINFRQTCRKSEPDILVHLAGIGGVRSSFKNPEYYRSVNVEGTKNVLNSCSLIGVQKVIYASSSSVYGDDERSFSSESDSLLRPKSPYAETKVNAEICCENYAEYFPQGIISCRFFSVYGPKQRPDMAIARFTEFLKTDQPIPIYGDGNATRDFTYVSDIVDGIVSAIETYTSNHIPINLGSSRPISVNQLTETLASLLGKMPRIEYQPCQRGDAKHTNADINLAKQLLGYSPKISLTSGLGNYLESLRRED